MEGESMAHSSEISSPLIEEYPVIVSVTSLSRTDMKHLDFESSFVEVRVDSSRHRLQNVSKIEEAAPHINDSTDITRYCINRGGYPWDIESVQDLGVNVRQKIDTESPTTQRMINRLADDEDGVHFNRECQETGLNASNEDLRTIIEEKNVNPQKETHQLYPYSPHILAQDEIEQWLLLPYDSKCSNKHEEKLDPNNIARQSVQEQGIIILILSFQY